MENEWMDIYSEALKDWPSAEDGMFVVTVQQQGFSQRPAASVRLPFPE